VESFLQALLQRFPRCLSFEESDGDGELFVDVRADGGNACERLLSMLGLMLPPEAVEAAAELRLEVDAADLVDTGPTVKVIDNMRHDAAELSHILCCWCDVSWGLYMQNDRW
jgi:hypothetical protein